MAKAEQKLTASFGCRNFVGSAPSIQRALRQMQRYQMLSEPVLILGESGTGKELAAKKLVPAGKPLVAVNCAKFLNQEGVFESEVFGHVRGAFSGALHDHKGLIEEAEGGVLFLDEVHALSLSSQQKLLRVLQEHTYRRVGEARERKLGRPFRLVAAAKDDLHQRVQAGSFLPDFYFRIHTLTIELVPLRERLEDLKDLSEHFLKEIHLKLKLRVRLSSCALKLMRSYSWPGNIRELKSCLFRMSVDSGKSVLEASDFASYLKETGVRITGRGSEPKKSYKEFLQSAEAHYFHSVMAVCRSKEEVLEKTGVSKSTLYRKLSELGLKQSYKGAEEELLYLRHFKSR